MKMWKGIPRSVQISGYRRIDQPHIREERSVELNDMETQPYEPHSIDRKTGHSKSSASITYSKSKLLLRQWWSSFGEGWRFGAINCSISVIIVFWVNLAVTIWGTAHRTSSDEVVFEAECDKVSKINSGLHLLINLLSTILLSASNYTMQCLSAPTRKDVDQAHAKGTWLDVGIPSIRNLRYISRRRAVTWLLLGLSSLPLHLFYNSMVYSSISSTSYYGILINESFLTQAECQRCDSLDAWDTQECTIVKELRQNAKNGSLSRLDNSDCISAYSTMIQSFRRNLFLVVKDDDVPPAAINCSVGTYLLDSIYVQANNAQNSYNAKIIYNWICRSDLGASAEACAKNVGGIKKDAANWHIKDYPIQYCLSERITPMCKLHILLPIGWLVTILNLFKAALILYTALMIKEDPLLTMGDAVVSFLEENDPTTRDMCLLTMEDVKKQPKFSPLGPKGWSDTQYRWKDVTSKTRRMTTLIMFLLALAIVIGCLSYGIRDLHSIDEGTSLSHLAKLGFGAGDLRTIIQWDITGTMNNILIANAPQPIISILYFSYNGLFTCMLLGYEWVSYAHTRKGLRVSKAPKGEQRSTYFLQLPYRFSLPLMGLSGILHWLVSQSIFLVAIDFYTETGLPDGYAITCGFSPIAIVTVIVVGIFMVLNGVGVGFVPYKKGLNLAASCSAAISAACHGEEFDEIEGKETAIEKVQWGVVGTKNLVGRCAFSARVVRSPEKGKLYA